MKPLNFVSDNGSDYNQPTGQFLEALQKPIKIFSSDGEWEILSYYYSEKDKCMVLDIQRKEKKSVRKKT